MIKPIRPLNQSAPPPNAKTANEICTVRLQLLAKVQLSRAKLQHVTISHKQMAYFFLVFCLCTVS